MTNEQPKKPKGPGIFHNWLTLLGALISLGGFFSFILLFAIDVFAHHGNPYMGILAYVVSPGFIFLGIFLALFGIWLERRHRRLKGKDSKPHPLVIDFTSKKDRKILVFFAAVSVLFLLLSAIGSNRTYHYTESTQFCGQACHTPMKPEYTTYKISSHARVACTECHVGEGASHYVKAKLNGVHQLCAMVTDSFERPIPTPVKNLRPAQETCEQCHWPEKFSGNLDRTYQHFLADETNTPFAVRLSLKVGGSGSGNRPPEGIHWHVSLDNKVEYIATDRKREKIPWVRYTDRKGVVTEYRAPDFKDDISKYEIRTMDCLDCHNRPAHQFRSPNDSVDAAMAAGLIDVSLPWAKSNVVAALVRPYATEAEAVKEIAAFLKERYPATPQRESMVAEAQNIFTNSFFPEMKADWRAYPDHIGHKDWAGCFRCHDGLHKTEDRKKTISGNDCNSCHTILAQGSGAELQKLNPNGHSFFHIDSINEDFSCNECHTGGIQKE